MTMPQSETVTYRWAHDAIIGYTLGLDLNNGIIGSSNKISMALSVVVSRRPTQKEGLVKLRTKSLSSGMFIG